MMLIMLHVSFSFVLFIQDQNWKREQRFSENSLLQLLVGSLFTSIFLLDICWRISSKNQDKSVYYSCQTSNKYFAQNHQDLFFFSPISQNMKKIKLHPM